MFSPTPRWFLSPLGADMDQLNTYFLFSLGSLLRDCKENCHRPTKHWIVSAGNAENLLTLLLYEYKGSRFLLEESSKAAHAIKMSLMHAHLDHVTNGEGSLSKENIEQLQRQFAVFDEAIAAELSRAPIFYVSPKGLFDTRRLISKASSVYQGYADRLPKETIADTDEAGRCLAFSLPTASGFHMARATESVIKQYMAMYGCQPPKESDRNWKNYIRALIEKKAHPKITHHLDQIRDLHRNPISHPDTVLTMPQATAFMALCQSVIQAMVGDMESKHTDRTPDATIAALRPTDDDGAQEPQA